MICKDPTKAWKVTLRQFERRRQIGMRLCVLLLYSLLSLQHFGELREFLWKASYWKNYLPFKKPELPSRNMELCWFNVATSFVTRGVFLDGHQKHHAFYKKFLRTVTIISPRYSRKLLPTEARWTAETAPPAGALVEGDAVRRCTKIIWPRG